MSSFPIGLLHNQSPTNQLATTAAQQEFDPNLIRAEIIEPGDSPEDAPWDRMWRLLIDAKIVDNEGRLLISDRNLFLKEAQYGFLMDLLLKKRTIACRLTTEKIKFAFSALQRYKQPHIEAFLKHSFFAQQERTLPLRASLINIFLQIFSTQSAANGNEMYFLRDKAGPSLFDNWGMHIIRSIFKKVIGHNKVPEELTAGLEDTPEMLRFLFLSPGTNENDIFDLHYSIIHAMANALLLTDDSGIPQDLRKPCFVDCWAVIIQNTAFESHFDPIRKGLDSSTQTGFIVSSFRDVSETSNKISQLFEITIANRPLEGHKALRFPLRQLVVNPSIPNRRINQKSLLEGLIAYFTNVIDIGDTSLFHDDPCSLLSLQIQGARFLKAKGAIHNASIDFSIYTIKKTHQVYHKEQPLALQALLLHALNAHMEKGVSDFVQEAFLRECQSIVEQCSLSTTSCLSQLMLQAIFKETISPQAVFALFGISTFFLLNTSHAKQPGKQIEAYLRPKNVLDVKDGDFFVRSTWNINCFKMFLELLRNSPSLGDSLELQSIIEYLEPIIPYDCHRPTPVRRVLKLSTQEVEQLERVALDYLSLKIAIAQRIGYELLLVCNTLTPNIYIVGNLLRYLSLTKHKVLKREIISLTNSFDRIPSLSDGELSKQLYRFVNSQELPVAQMIVILCKCKFENSSLFANLLWNDNYSYFSKEEFRLIRLTFVERMCQSLPERGLSCLLTEKKHLSSSQQTGCFDRVCRALQSRRLFDDQLLSLSEIFLNLTHKPAESHWLLAQLVNHNHHSAFACLKKAAESKWILHHKQTPVGLWLDHCEKILAVQGGLPALERWLCGRKLGFFQNDLFKTEKECFVQRLIIKLSAEDTPSHEIPELVQTIQDDPSVQKKALSGYLERLSSQGDYKRVLEETAGSLSSVLTPEEQFEYRIKAFRKFVQKNTSIEIWSALKKAISLSRDDQDRQKIQKMIEENSSSLVDENIFFFIASPEFALLYKGCWIEKITLIYEGVQSLKNEKISQENAENLLKIIFEDFSEKGVVSAQKPFFDLFIRLLSASTSLSAPTKKSIEANFPLLTRYASSKANLKLRFTLLELLMKFAIPIPVQQMTWVLNIVRDSIKAVQRKPSESSSIQRTLSECDKILSHFQYDRLFPEHETNLQIVTYEELITSYYMYVSMGNAREECNENILSRIDNLLELFLKFPNLLTPTHERFFFIILPSLLLLGKNEMAERVLNVLEEKKSVISEKEYYTIWKLIANNYALKDIMHCAGVYELHSLVFLKHMELQEVNTIFPELINRLINLEVKEELMPLKLRKALKLLSIYIPSHLESWPLVLTEIARFGEADLAKSAWEEWILAYKALESKGVPDRSINSWTAALGCLSSVPFHVFSRDFDLLLTLCPYFTDDRLKHYIPATLEFIMLICHKHLCRINLFPLFTSEIEFLFDKYKIARNQMYRFSTEEGRQNHFLTHLEYLNEWISIGNLALNGFVLETLKNMMTEESRFLEQPPVFAQTLKTMIQLVKFAKASSQDKSKSLIAFERTLEETILLFIHSTQKKADLFPLIQELIAHSLPSFPLLVVEFLILILDNTDLLDDTQKLRLQIIAKIVLRRFLENLKSIRLNELVIKLLNHTRINILFTSEMLGLVG